MADPSNVYQRLKAVQEATHAPRAVSGKFGMARSAEQILEAYKPACNEHGLYLYTTDRVKQVGDRNYIVATAFVVNVDNPTEFVSASAAAWENEVERNKFGAAILDTSQVTGKTSSYAKKYALQHLFAIDDTKDADSQDNTHSAPVKPVEAPKPAVGTPPSELATEVQKRQVKSFLTALGVAPGEMKQYIEDNFLIDTEKMTKKDAIAIIEAIK